MQEEREVIQQMMESMESEMPPLDEEEGDVRLQFGYDIKEPAVPMQDIQDEEKKSPYKEQSSVWIVKNCAMAVRCLRII